MSTTAKALAVDLRAETIALIERAKHLTQAEQERLDSEWEATDSLEWDRAWTAAERAVVRRGGNRNAVEDSVEEAAGSADEVPACGAIWDAALAVELRDELSPEHFEALYRPWARVVDRPAQRAARAASLSRWAPPTAEAILYG